jgi:hypothetical protein
MNKLAARLILITTIAALAPSSFAQLNIPSDGSDGALLIRSNTMIDLSQAVTGNWNDNNGANAGKGVYDSNQWAVVFKYSSVLISNGATLTFTNHPSHAPVVWLVSGDVTISSNAVVSLDGQTAGYDAPHLAEPGPGGFRGGTGTYAPGVDRSAGFGPGGGPQTSRRFGNNNDYGGGGSYGTVGAYGPGAYGNPSLIPLLGGSGGGGYYGDTRGGGAGGGAVLIAAAGNLSISGTVRANGGGSGGGTGGGSGGGVRLIANSLVGNGVVQCIGGGGSYAGGLGRIRIERVSTSGNLQITPDPSVVPLLASDTPLVWLPTNGPTARIVSIGGVAATTDPRASFGTYGPDVTLPQTNTAVVVVETVNAESASVVKVRGAPRANGDFSEVTATLTQTNSLDPLILRWTASLPVNNGFSSVIARVIRP